MRWLLLVPVLLAGCLERDEEIKFGRDGSVEVAITLKGDPKDFDRFVTLPEGWEVTKTKEMEESAEKVVWKTRKKLSRAHDYPDCKVETVGGFRVYTFERTYEQTNFKDYQIVDEHMFKDQEFSALVEKMGDRGIRALTPLERSRLFELAAKAELEKRMTIAVRAVEKFGLRQNIPWRDQLEAIGKISKLYECEFSGKAVSDTIEKCLTMPDDEQQKFLTEFHDGLVRKTAEACGMPVEIFHDERNAYDHGMSIADDTFKIAVEFPGTIVSSNAKSVDGSRAYWEFSGSELADKSVTLRAVAVEKIK